SPPKQNAPSQTWIESDLWGPLLLNWFVGIPYDLRKSLQKFSPARRNNQISRNEHLTSLDVSQGSQSSGKLTNSFRATATVIFYLSLIVNVLRSLAHSMLRFPL